MKESNLPLYQLKRGDKSIFLLFFILFPSLMIINDLDETGYKIEIDQLIIWLLLTVDAIILVYLTVFKWIKQNSGGAGTFKVALQFLGLASLLIAGETIAYWYFFERELYGLAEAWSDTLSVSIVFIVTTVALLGAIMSKKSVDAQIQILRNESLQKANELRLLKSQIDPHFLFNNLNTLDALIDTEPQRAKPYIQRLAQLYQYLLATKDEDIIGLDNEMTFARNYIYLIQERFDQNYQFEIIDRRSRNDLKVIPPGAVQTVFENIVKHNTASRNQPIVATITIHDTQVVIRNNIRSKNKPMASFKLGLNNLQARYRLLSDQDIEVEVDDFYTIKLPLLEALNA